MPKARLFAIATLFFSQEVSRDIRDCAKQPVVHIPTTRHTSFSNTRDNNRDTITYNCTVLYYTQKVQKSYYTVVLYQIVYLFFCRGMVCHLIRLVKHETALHC